MSGAGPVRIAASLGIAAVLATMVGSAGLSRQAIAAGNAIIPAGLWGAQGDGLELGAEMAHERDETVRSEALARDALRHSLGHVAALRIMAQTAQLRGNQQATARYMALAGRWSWRDTPVQGWLFDDAVVRRDFRRAMDHADAILRMRQIEREMFGVLRYAGEDPDFRRALASRLADKPGWRGGFFADAAQVKADQRAGLEATINELRRTKAPATPVELRSYAALLIGSGDVARAAALWASQFSGDPDQGTIFGWPGEARARERLPFDWRITSPRGISVVTANTDNAPLSIVADHGALGFVAARLSALSPGHYRLTLTGTQPTYAVRGALGWTLQCQGGPTLKADMTDDGWTFGVPQGCAVQTIQLGIDNPDARFEASLGAVRLQRVGGETSAITG